MFTRALGSATSPAGFEGQFRYLCDQQGLSTAAGRHPSADLLPVFNASRKALRDLVCSYGYTLFMQRGTTTSLPTTPVEAGEQYAVIDVGASGSPGTISPLLQVKRIDVKLNGQDWKPLDEVTFNQLRDISSPRFGYSTTPTRPRGWCWLNAGVETNPAGVPTHVKGQIAIAPVPTQGQYALWTMNEEADLVTTSDVWLYHSEDWAQWQMWDAMAKICGARDKDSARKLDFIVNNRLNREVPGSPAFNIWVQRPTAAGPRTWTRGANYRGPWGR
jgi:hypothetical protein